MPTPDSEDKVNGGQMMNYESDTFQDYESITIDEFERANQQLTGPGNRKTAPAARIHE